MLPDPFIDTLTINPHVTEICGCRNALLASLSVWQHRTGLVLEEEKTFTELWISLVEDDKGFTSAQHALINLKESRQDGGEQR